jgi:hypothetical protein
MALVKCSECGREVSSQAAACPGCGCPVSAAVAAPVAVAAQTGHGVTVEQTSKRWKGQALMAGLLFFGGFAIVVPSCIAESSNATIAGALVCFAGACWGIYVKLMTWWHHG